MKKGTLIRGLSLGTGLVLALAGSAQADVHGDVITFPQKYPLAHATRTVVQGQRVGVAASDTATRAANCRLPRASLRLAPSERAVELREVALNLRTCRAVFERGVPPRGARHIPSPKQQSSGANAPGGGTAPGVHSLANGYTWSGSSSAWYTDYRTGRIVTQVNNGADWNSNGSCIGLNRTWFRDYADTPTRWFEASHNWTFVNNICGYVSTSTDARFRNRHFSGCQGGGTVVNSYYSRVRFVGYPDGTISGSKSSWNQPSCYGVLVAYYALYR